MMLAGLEGTIDVIVPRGGKSLVERVQNDARVPVFSHLDGICHTYIHASADLEMAKDITLNAKLRRTGICGATETLLVDRQCADTHLKPLVEALLDEGCEVRGDEDVASVDERVVMATAQDWDTEYLDSIISVKLIEGVEDAISHIAAHGSGHTEAIISEDASAAEACARTNHTNVERTGITDADLRKCVYCASGERHYDLWCHLFTEF